MWLLILYLLIAIGVSFMCSILEAVILSITPSFVRIREEEDSQSAHLLKSLKDQIDRPLSAILTLNTIAHTIGAAGVGAQAVKVFGEVYFGLISAVLTILILVFSEVIPKTLGARYWRQLAIPSARIIRVLVIILYPLVIASEGVTTLFIRSKKKKPRSITREDIAILTRLGSREGAIKESEGHLINNVLKMKSIRVKQALTPRTVVVAAQEDMTVGDFFGQREEMKFSRIPLYTDTIEDCNGYVLKNDVLERLVAVKGSLKLKEIKRPAIIVPEMVFIDKVFEQMLVQKEHIALVVDEYGGFEGIITMEDIIETLLGLEIQDETDTHKDMQELARERWRVRGKGR